MENTELLERLLAAIAQGNETLRREIREEIRGSQEILRTEFRESQEALKKDIIDQVVEAMNTQSEALVKMIDKRVSEAETRINIKLEHEIDHQLKALLDGYKLNHDKNQKQDARLDKLDSRVERLEVRMDVLEEHKTA